MLINKNDSFYEQKLLYDTCMTKKRKFFIDEALVSQA